MDSDGWFCRYGWGLQLHKFIWDPGDQGGLNPGEKKNQLNAETQRATEKKRKIQEEADRKWNRIRISEKPVVLLRRGGMDSCVSAVIALEEHGAEKPWSPACELRPTHREA